MLLGEPLRVSIGDAHLVQAAGALRQQLSQLGLVGGRWSSSPGQGWLALQVEQREGDQGRRPAPRRRGSGPRGAAPRHGLQHVHVTAQPRRQLGLGQRLDWDEDGDGRVQGGLLEEGQVTAGGSLRLLRPGDPRALLAWCALPRPVHIRPPWGLLSRAAWVLEGRRRIDHAAHIIVAALPPERKGLGEVVMGGEQSAQLLRAEMVLRQRRLVLFHAHGTRCQDQARYREQQREPEQQLLLLHTPLPLPSHLSPLPVLAATTTGTRNLHVQSEPLHAKKATFCGMSIHYTIQPTSPAAHIFTVTLEISNPDPTGQVLRLPAWIPGSYLVREFSKNIVQIEARDGSENLVGLDKLDKHTWKAAPVSRRPEADLPSLRLGPERAHGPPGPEPRLLQRHQRLPGSELVRPRACTRSTSRPPATPTAPAGAWPRP